MIVLIVIIYAVERETLHGKVRGPQGPGMGGVCIASGFKNKEIKDNPIFSCKMHSPNTFHTPLTSDLLLTPTPRPPPDTPSPPCATPTLAPWSGACGWRPPHPHRPRLGGKGLERHFVIWDITIYIHLSLLVLLVLPPHCTCCRF